MTALLARMALGSVFALAGLAKLADPEGVRRMVVEFGSPKRLAGPLASALVGCELGVALALAIGPSARVGAAASLGLLLIFAVVIAITVSRGRRPECRCFGRLRQRPVGWSTVARNAALGAPAGFVAAGGRLPLLFGAIGLLAIAWWLTLELRKTGLVRVGAAAPPVSLPDQDGQLWTLDEPQAERCPTLLVFAALDCGACHQLLPEVARWQAQLAPKLRIAVVSGGSTGDNLRLARELGLRSVLSDDGGGVTGAFGIAATPSAVLLDAARRFSANTVVGADEIAHLVARTTTPDRDPTLGRRAILVRAATGFAALAVGPLIESATATAQSIKRAVRPKSLKIDGAWLCDQRYALCTISACKPSKTNKHVSVCPCKVKTGYSVGFKTCEKRAPRGKQLHSNFSLQDVTNRTRVLKCVDRGLWVQCLDVVCEVDPRDPSRASCQCVNERTKNFYTFAGNCDTKTCRTVIWSATTAPFPGGAQYEKGLRRLGIPYKVPKACPTPKRG